MKNWRWLGWLAFAVMVAGMRGQVPELNLTRPGTIVVTELAGTVSGLTGEQRKAMKADERVRIGSTIATGRRSMVSLLFSNGALVRLGPDAELEIEEFGQAPIASSVKPAEVKEEPTLSRTKLRLASGDISLTVKPLKAARGSTFTLSLIAGTLRISEGVFRAVVHMSDLGLGVCNIELQSGVAEFEPVGGKFTPLRIGQKFAFAIEQDKARGTVKIGEMPKEVPAPKK